MSIFLDILVVYLLYRFIAGFLVPLFRTTSTMRQQFRNMHEHNPYGGQSQTGAADSQAHTSAKQETKGNATKSNSGKVGEYIDFEEVK
jgi:hypothetical protein